jgi:anti-sigma28 factor (negative regulator of flagellin synthesis)
MKKQEKKQKELSAIFDILDNGSIAEVRALFAFNKKTTLNDVLKKFRLWSRWYFPDYFLDQNEEAVSDAPFHIDFDTNTLKVYRGEQSDFVNAGFRGCAKTTRNKLLVAFCVANDEDNSRKFIKVLSSDGSNSKQFVTDVYNMFVTERVAYHYPEIFQKGAKKREETMSSFTTSSGVKISSGTVGMEQRGDVQEESRPDFIIFTDFETRKTLRSAVITQAIWDNMEEARTGLSKNGGAVYECNYLSERGNVHRLIKSRNNVLITPIVKDNEPTWSAQYTIQDIENIKQSADDFTGEYLCQPSASFDVLFDRECLEKQIPQKPIKIIAGFKMFYEFNPAHRYGGGADVSGGVGLDHSTTCFIDFTQNPNRVVATFKSNTIKPDVFGDEIERQCSLLGNPIFAPEANNHGHATIGRLKQIYDNLYLREISDVKKDMGVISKDYGWMTTVATRPKMIFDLKKAIEDGHLELTDEELIDELRSFTRDDLMDKTVDPRLTTRHFDLLIACAVAWQMRRHADRANIREEVAITQREKAMKTRRVLTGNTR